MAVYITDNFNRADGALGGTWTQRVGTWVTISNQAAVSPFTAQSLATVPAAADVDVTLKNVLGLNTCGIVARLVDTSNYLFMVSDSGSTISLYHRIAGTAVQLGNVGGFLAGDVFRMVCKGRLIYCYQNGKLIVALEDPAYDLASSWGTHAGMYINVSGARLDDVTVQDAPATMPGSPTTGKVVDDAFLRLPVTTPSSPSTVSPGLGGWLYRGRDTKTADAGRP